MARSTSNIINWEITTYFKVLLFILNIVFISILWPNGRLSGVLLRVCLQPLVRQKVIFQDLTLQITDISEALPIWLRLCFHGRLS
ncbi:MAG: hypothetical protein P8X90_34205, partial [Desulfobacterales bacterium]